MGAVPVTELLGDRSVPENVVPAPSVWAAERAAAGREQRRLMDAALEVMREHPTRSPRVSDIVARARLSNNAFYRHFRSKDDLVLAILDDGRRTLLAYLEHLMARERTAVGKVERWIEAMMAQATDPAAAAATRAVHLNARRVDGGAGAPGRRAEADLRAVLELALAEAGTVDPGRDAHVIWQAVVGSMTDSLVRDVKPSSADVAHLVSFCVAGLGASHGA